MTRQPPPKDGRHTTSTTPNKCVRWLAEEAQYVTVDCSRHADAPPGVTAPTPRKQPACGNPNPHSPHNGFAIGGVAESAEPWCKGVEPAEIESPPPMAEQLKDLLDRNTELTSEMVSLRNALDIAHADWTHLKRWGAQQLKELHRAIAVEADEDEPRTTAVVALANQRRGIRMMLAEISRLENAISQGSA